MRRYYVVAGLAVVAFIVLGASSFLGTMTPYVETFEEARASVEAKVQVPGDLVKDSESFDRKTATLLFAIEDPEGDRMVIAYQGVRPSNLDDADRVVAVGRYDPDEDVFRAEQLLVKCPSKYQSK